MKSSTNRSKRDQNRLSATLAHHVERHRSIKSSTKSSRGSKMASRGWICGASVVDFGGGGGWRPLGDPLATPWRTLGVPLTPPFGSPGGVRGGKLLSGSLV